MANFFSSSPLYIRIRRVLTQQNDENAVFPSLSVCTAGLHCSALLCTQPAYFTCAKFYRQGVQFRFRYFAQLAARCLLGSCKVRIINCLSNCPSAYTRGRSVPDARTTRGTTTATTETTSTTQAADTSATSHTSREQQQTWRGDSFVFCQAAQVFIFSFNNIEHSSMAIEGNQFGCRGDSSSNIV